MLFCGITWSQEKCVGIENLRIIPPSTSHWGGLQKNEGEIFQKGRRTGKIQIFQISFIKIRGIELDILCGCSKG